jgi:hypothetical protein
VQTARCEVCGVSARCGSCRNVHSCVHREAGTLSSARAPPRSRARRATTEIPRAPTEPPVLALDLPRTREGLDAYYRLLARESDDLWCAARRARRAGRATCGERRAASGERRAASGVPSIAPR